MQTVEKQKNNQYIHLIILWNLDFSKIVGNLLMDLVEVLFVLFQILQMSYQNRIFEGIIDISLEIVSKLLNRRIFV